MSSQLDENLLSAYMSCVALYDKKVPEYKDRNVRENMWASISKAIGITREQCETRMKQLRERYVREKKAAETTSGQAAATGSAWPLFHLCSFLDDHVRPRKTVGSFKKKEVEEDVSADLEDSFMNTHDFLYEETIDSLDSHAERQQSSSSSSSSRLSPGPRPNIVKPNVQATPSVQRKTKGKRHLDEEADLNAKMAKVSDAAASLCASVANAQCSDNEDTLFGKYVGKELSKIVSDELKDQLKIDFMNLLMKAKATSRKNV